MARILGLTYVPGAAAKGLGARVAAPIAMRAKSRRVDGGMFCIGGPVLPSIAEAEIFFPLHFDMKVLHNPL